MSEINLCKAKSGLKGFFIETFINRNILHLAGVPTSSSTEKQKDSLIDLNDQATGGDVDVLNTKFSALCKFPSPKNLSKMSFDVSTVSATSQLSKIKSTPAKVDEFDMLAQSRTGSDGKTAAKDIDVDLLQGPASAKPADFDEIEEWLRAEKSSANPNDGEESLTSKEFDKFLAERAAVADTLPNISNRNSDESRSKKKQDEPLLG